MLCPVSMKGKNIVELRWQDAPVFQNKGREHHVGRCNKYELSLALLHIPVHMREYKTSFCHTREVRCI